MNAIDTPPEISNKKFLDWFLDEVDEIVIIDNSELNHYSGGVIYLQEKFLSRDSDIDASLLAGLLIHEARHAKGPVHCVGCCDGPDCDEDYKEWGSYCLNHYWHAERFRTTGLHWEKLNADSLLDRICENVPEELIYTYLSPLYVFGKDSRIGLGIKNVSMDWPAEVSIVAYSRNGEVLTLSNHNIPRRGQIAFVLDADDYCEGWLLISSTTPLLGVELLVDTLTTDVPISESNKELQIPHVAQNTLWDTSIFVCNPNDSVNSVTMKFIDTAGKVLYSRNYTIQAMGAGEYNLAELLGNELQNSGSIEIEATKGIGAFAIYSNLKSGGNSFSGLAANPSQ